MRMAQAAPLHQSSRFITSALPSQQVASQVLSTSPTLPGRTLPPEEPVPKNNPGRLPNSTQRKWGIFSTRRHQNESGKAPESLKPGNTHESALNDSLLGVRLGGSEPSTGDSSSQVESISSGHLADGAIALSPWRTTSELSIDEPNPWREERSISNGGVEKAASPAMSPASRRTACVQRRQSTEATLIEKLLRPSQEPKPMGRIAPYKPRKQLVPESLPVAESGRPSQPEGTQKKFPFMQTLSPIISQTQTNQSAVTNSRYPYGGYCEGAFKLQVGLDKDSVNLRNQSTAMTGQSNYWACASSKCAFEGPACKKGKIWTFDDTVRVHNAVQYRWTFLAKCHVALSRVKNGQHDYQCVFCGVQPSANNVYRGEKAFVEHVSQQHRGQQPDPSILDKICCIHGRVAREEEIFDVNLTPKEGSPLVHRQVFVHAPDPITESLDDNAGSNDGVFEWPAIEELSSTSQRE